MKKVIYKKAELKNTNLNNLNNNNASNILNNNVASPSKENVKITEENKNNNENII